MKHSHICLFLWVNIVATIAAYYKKCYQDFLLCLSTHTTAESKFGLSRPDADKWCKEHSSSLAIITNETIQSAIAAFINDSSADSDSDIITNGYRYTDDTWKWISGRNSDIYPRTDYHYYRYAYIVLNSGSTYVLFDRQSTSKRKFVCSYLKRNSGCREGYIHFQGSCYKMHDKNVTWFDSRYLCLKEERSDLAVFENGLQSYISEWQRDGEYWIGLRKENWVWVNDNKYYTDIKYSNWDALDPSSTGGHCVCLKSRTGKWTNCNCSWKYRYICIQDYASGLESTEAPSTTKSTTTTITTTAPHSQSTPTYTLDDNSINKVSDRYRLTSDVLPVIGIGIACLLILIVVIAVVAFIKIRRSSHSDDPGPNHGNSLPPTMGKDDTPSTVYAGVVPNANETSRSPSEMSPNQTVYAELELAPKGKVSQRASEPFPSHLGKAPSQSVYAELDLVPREKTHGRAVRLPESEYANILHVDSVYANIAHTGV